ncbi:MAG: thioredoxin fold domain-containing protein [Candidatus Accumulibacter sp.]|nr:thioredoxin fold domain-containing protein [Accumulibacter sp.]
MLTGVQVLIGVLSRLCRPRFAAALFAFAFSAPAPAALFDADAADLQAEIRAAGREGRRLAVFFELPGCPECGKMKRLVFPDPGVEERFGRAYLTRRIDLASAAPIVDADGRRRAPAELAERLRIFAAPAFVFFDAGGLPEYRHVGSLTRPADFALLGRFVAEAIYENRPFSDYLHDNSPSGKMKNAISPREAGEKHGKHPGEPR